MDFYVISAISNAIVSFVLGFFVFFKNKTSDLNKTFSLYCLMLFLWSVAYFFWQISNDYDSALFWSRALMMGAIFIPITYLHFVFILTKKIKENRKLLTVGYLVFTLFFIVSFNRFFVESVTPKLGFDFWPNPGPLFHPFILIWISCVLFFLFFLIKETKNSFGIKQAQLKYILIATIIGFSGGATNYFLWYDISIPPIGNWAVSVYIIIVSYAIIKYRFMDIRLALSRGTVYFLSLVIVILIAYGFLFLNNQLAYPLSDNVAFLLILIISLLLFHPILNFLEKLASKYFHYTFYSYHKVLADLSEKLTRILDLEKLSSLITDTLMETMKLDRTVVLLRDESTGRYDIQKNIGFKEENGISLVQDNFLTEYLKETQKPLVFEELSLMIKNEKDERKRERMQRFQENMKRIEANLCIPLLIKDKIIGMIVLGNKISGQPYFEQDISLLINLSNQASIALQNALLYSQVEDFSKELEKRVEEQTGELKKAYKELQASDKAKSVFISMASHQLRTPLTSLRGYASMLLDGTYGEIPEAPKEKVRIIMSSTERLIGIVNKLLSISKIDLGKIDAEKNNQNINELIKSCLEEMRAEGEQKGLSMVFKPSKTKKMEVDVDSGKIKETITNIIENSIRYTDKGKVEVGIKEKKNSFVVYVKDTGEGLEKDEKESIFGGFTRGKAGVGKFIEGTGLGLYLSKKYVELHNGKIWAESKGIGKGSTFYIEIPFLNEKPRNF